MTFSHSCTLYDVQTPPLPPQPCFLTLPFRSQPSCLPLPLSLYLPRRQRCRHGHLYLNRQQWYKRANGHGQCKHLEAGLSLHNCCKCCSVAVCILPLGAHTHYIGSKRWTTYERPEQPATLTDTSTAAQETCLKQGGPCTTIFDAGL